MSLHLVTITHDRKPSNVDDYMTALDAKNAFDAIRQVLNSLPDDFGVAANANLPRHADLVIRGRELIPFEPEKK